MKAYLVGLGIPSQDIYEDHAGYSTYESMYRARHVFGAQRIIVTTQAYHLYRSLYAAHGLGMEAVGVASDHGTYLNQTSYSVREVLARTKDFFNTLVQNPQGECGPIAAPGEQVSLAESGDFVVSIPAIHSGWADSAGRSEVRPSGATRRPTRPQGELAPTERSVERRPGESVHLRESYCLTFATMFTRRPGTDDLLHDGFALKRVGNGSLSGGQHLFLRGISGHSDAAPSPCRRAVTASSTWLSFAWSEFDSGHGALCTDPSRPSTVRHNSSAQCGAMGAISFTMVSATSASSA